MTEKSTIRFGTDGWRAVIGEGMTFDNMRIIAQAFADYLNRQNQENHVAVSFDTRFLSEQFADILCGVLAANEIPVALSNHFTPTPVLSFNVKNSGFTAGIMITASHNPYTYNGIKFKSAAGGPAQPEATSAIEKFLYKTPPRSDPALAKKLIEKVDFYAPYQRNIMDLIDAEQIRRFSGSLIYDAMFGAGMAVFEDLMHRCGLSFRSLHSSWNPGFNRIPPEPISENLKSLQTELHFGKEILGIATDGDADRLGVLNEEGEFVAMHELFALLFRYLYQEKGWRGSVVRTTSMAATVDLLATPESVQILEVPVGFRNVCKVMQEEDVLIGGEESGGIGYGRFIPERDGLLSAMFIIEMLSFYAEPIGTLISGLREQTGYTAYDRIDFPVPDLQLKSGFAQIKKNPPDRFAGQVIKDIRHMDGIKFIFSERSWLLMRASDTEPLARVYAAAEDDQTVQELLSAGKRLITGSETLK